uniref:Uncharacterized protein n=1 Tax=Panagrolaimus sp. PS1159 TaxID=55785 RepID=A0AC35G7S6_9BILA
MVLIRRPGPGRPTFSASFSIPVQHAKIPAVTSLLEIHQQKLQWIRQAQGDNRRLIENLQNINRELNADALQLKLCIIYNSKLQE